MKDPSKPAGYDVLAIGAHPDDVEMGMAGTVARLTRAGRRVLIVYLTRGDASTHGTPETRSRETEAAASILGADVKLFDFPDTRVENNDEGRLLIARLAREHRPSLVFAPYHTNSGTHHDGAANRDHVATGGMVRDGLKLARFRRLLPDLEPHDVRRILYYMVPADRLPTLIVDVTPVEEIVFRAIRAYDSQMQIQRRENSIQEVLEGIRRWYGIRIGKKLGEGFLSDEPLEPGPEELFRI